MKEHYRHRLPHFQQPGQAYFITWNLKGALPRKALERHSKDLNCLRSKILLEQRINSDNSYEVNNPGKFHAEFLFDDLIISHDCSPVLSELKMRYYVLRKKYMKAYDNILHANLNPSVNLYKPENLKILKDTLQYWAENKIQNYAFCIMPNHVHWVLRLNKKDVVGNIVLLPEILYSVKRYSATQINKAESRNGSLWQAESFETTIRNDRHLYNAIEYTLNNPVSAGLIKDREKWDGNYLNEL
jgi:putative transposase